MSPEQIVFVFSVMVISVGLASAAVYFLFKERMKSKTSLLIDKEEFIKNIQRGNSEKLDAMKQECDESHNKYVDACLEVRELKDKLNREKNK
jgi:hypothetical protein